MVMIAANEVSYSRPRSVVARLGGPVVAGVGWVGGSDLLSLSLSLSLDSLLCFSSST